MNSSKEYITDKEMDAIKERLIRAASSLEVGIGSAWVYSNNLVRILNETDAVSMLSKYYLQPDIWNMKRKVRSIDRTLGKLEKKQKAVYTKIRSTDYRDMIYSDIEDLTL